MWRLPWFLIFVTASYAAQIAALSCVSMEAGILDLEFQNSSYLTDISQYKCWSASCGGAPNTGILYATFYQLDSAAPIGGISTINVIMRTSTWVPVVASPAIPKLIQTLAYINNSALLALYPSPLVKPSNAPFNFGLLNPLTGKLTYLAGACPAQQNAFALAYDASTNIGYVVSAST